MVGPGRILRPTSGNNAPRNVNDSSRRNQPFRYVRPMGPANSGGAFAVCGSTSIFVYNGDGTLRWSDDLIRNVTGDFGGGTGCAFGPNQEVWAGQDDFLAPAPVVRPRIGWLYRWDRNGNFLGESNVTWVVGLGTYLRVIRSNASGQLIRSQVTSSATMGQVISGSTFDLDNPWGSRTIALSMDDNGNAYGMASTSGFPSSTLFKWDSDGNLVSTVSSAYTGGTFDVYKDGSYYWTGFSTFTGDPGANYTTTLYKVSTTDGSLLMSPQTETSMLPLRAIRITPWGTRLTNYNGDIDASQVRSRQLIARKGTGLAFTLERDGETVYTGADNNVVALATSID